MILETINFKYRRRPKSQSFPTLYSAGLQKASTYNSRSLIKCNAVVFQFLYQHFLICGLLEMQLRLCKKYYSYNISFASWSRNDGNDRRRWNSSHANCNMIIENLRPKWFISIQAWVYLISQLGCLPLFGSSWTVIRIRMRM